MLQPSLVVPVRRPSRELSWARLFLTLLCASPGLIAQDGTAFMNFETAPVHPLAVTLDGKRLLVVNLPDARLDVFSILTGVPVYLDSVPVGLDPSSVRVLDDGTAWVTNRISDSVSVVDLDALTVRATLLTRDDPSDVVFAGEPLRAFVACSMADVISIYETSPPYALVSHVDPGIQRPRALAVSPDGGTVYAASFESGNGTTLLAGSSDFQPFPPTTALGDPAGPHGGANPPPNAGNEFQPPLGPEGPGLPEALIVRRDSQGVWRDDTGADWSAYVTGNLASLSGRAPGWDLLDRDVAAIKTDTLTVDWVPALMNSNMALAVHPDGSLLVVGTDGINEVRFEPVLNGIFARVLAAAVPSNALAGAVVDLNPQLDYSVATVDEATRAVALSDPRAVLFQPDGSRAFVAGMGSDNLVVVDSSGVRTGDPPIDVGRGPVGLAFDADATRLFVLNRFSATITTIEVASLAVLATTPLHDATPAHIRDGRRFLYDTRFSSGLGQAACGSCHIDGRMDRLAWDLGDPAGPAVPLIDRNLGAGIGIFSGGAPFHPMKGPMVTQTFQDIIGKEPFHWRADRLSLAEFADTPKLLQGRESPFNASEIVAFSKFLGSLHFPPNPHRALDNSLPHAVPLDGHVAVFAEGGLAVGDPLPPGDADNGLSIFRDGQTFGGFHCATCHTLPTGASTDHVFDFGTGLSTPFPPADNGANHLALTTFSGNNGNPQFKVPQLRNLHERRGLVLGNAGPAAAGFGFGHDGKVDRIERFLGSGTFAIFTNQDMADLVAFLLAFSGPGLPPGVLDDPLLMPGPKSQGAHAAVGAELTVAAPVLSAAEATRLTTLIDLAAASEVGLVAHASFGGERRGLAFTGLIASPFPLQVPEAQFQTDRAAEVVLLSQLLGTTAPGSETTFTAVPFGSQVRLGLDRDEDGIFDRDELDQGSDPADATPMGVFTAVGPPLAGAFGPPQLLGSGAIAANATLNLNLLGARPNAPCWLVVGFSLLNAPFKGGVLVPTPDVVVAGLITTPAGTLPLSFFIPPPVPAGVLVVMQEWIADDTAPFDFSASNGLTTTTL